MKIKIWFKINSIVWGFEYNLGVKRGLKNESMARTKSGVNKKNISLAARISLGAWRWENSLRVHNLTWKSNSENIKYLDLGLVCRWESSMACECPGDDNIAWR